MSDDRRWQLRLRSLRARLQEDLDRVGRLRRVTLRRPEIESLVADLDRQLDRADRAAVLTLVGATGAGKSALLNAVVGRPIALEGVDRPTTRDPVIYAPRDADLSALVEGLDTLAAGVAPRVVRYDAAAGSSGAYVLIDAPDLNSVEAAHRDAVRALAERSDVLVVVLHRQSVVEEAPVSFLDPFARRRGLIFVLNRADELAPAARDALVRQVRELADTRWHAADAPVVAMSARLAQAQPQAGLELQALLGEAVHENELARVRRRNAAGTAALLGELFAEVRDEVGADLRALPDEVAGGLDALSARIGDESASRWTLRRAGLSRQLWAEAAARWDGPGGWALRAGGFGALGLGAGAALARRHPLIAAGAAVGGLAAGEVERAVERQQLSGVEALLPTASEFSVWYREALSPARVRAGRLTADAGGLALPSTEAVLEAATDAAGEAWRTLVERDLPAAAEKSPLRYFHGLLDLPVYALAVWILYRVGEGFLRERYVGVDFLINAALLAGAYLFAVTFTIRRLLGGRARSMLADAIRRTRAGLVSWFEQARGAVARETGEVEAALHRLCDMESAWRGDGGARATSDYLRTPLADHYPSSGRERH